MLDFVPNHTAPDHPWVTDHPGYFVAGTASDLAREPHNYTRVHGPRGDRVLALGRDPYFAGWPDTVQLDYSKPATQEAMVGELLRIAAQCDGLRCDMAMLVLPEVFERTWGRRAPLFWPDAIRRVREKVPGFCFMAEVYWDLEWTMQHQGFDYAYDKRLYDRLREGHARPVREHLYAGLDYQRKLARFMENHDEPRAAATFARPMHEAAAIITYLSPGLRFFHHGQFEGHRKRISPHLIRAPRETTDEALQQFYERSASGVAAPGVPGRRMATARVRARMGAQLDVGLFRGVGLEGRRRRPPARCRQLRREPEPMLRARAASESRQAVGALRGFDGRCGGWFRSGKKRSRRTRSVPGHARMGLPRVRRHRGRVSDLPPRKVLQVLRPEADVDRRYFVSDNVRLASTGLFG